MEKVVWTKELVEMLIIKYQEHDNLYNVSHPHYSDRIKRSNAMFAICQGLKEISPIISEECIKRKMHTLRSQFIKEMREVGNSKRSGVGADDVYEPKLWCFSQLEFLKSHCSIRKSESNIPHIDTQGIDTQGIDTQDNVEEECVSWNSPSSDDMNPKKRKNITNIRQKTDTLKDILLRKLEKPQKFDWLRKQVVSELNSIKNKRIQRDTAWKIQLLLREAIVEDDNCGQAVVEEGPTCSSYALQGSTPISSEETSTSSFSMFYPVEEMSTTNNTQPPDIIELSLQGMYEDDDDL